MKKACFLCLLPSAMLLLSCACRNDIVWQRRYDSGQEDFGRTIAADGSQIIVGANWRNTVSDGVQIDWQLLKYSGEGKLLWRRVFDSGSPDWLSDMAVDREHNIFAAGWCASATSESTQLQLVKFSPTGEVIWSRQWPFGLTAQGLAVALGPDGGVLVTGSMFSGTVNADDDILLADVDRDGNLIRFDSLDFGADETGQDIALDRQGDIFLVGGQVPRSSTTDSVSTADIILVKLTSEHKTLWRRVYDSGDDDLNGSTGIDSAGAAYVGVTSQGDKNTTARLLKYSSGGELLLDRPFPSQTDVSCTDIAVDDEGAAIGCGGIGIGDRQCYLAWRYDRGSFAGFPGLGNYRHGESDLANALAVERDGDVILTGVTVAGSDPDILTIKLRDPIPKPGRR